MATPSIPACARTRYFRAGPEIDPRLGCPGACRVAPTRFQRGCSPGLFTPVLAQEPDPGPLRPGERPPASPAPVTHVGARIERTPGTDRGPQRLEITGLRLGSVVVVLAFRRRGDRHDLAGGGVDQDLMRDPVLDHAHLEQRRTVPVLQHGLDRPATGFL